MISIEALSAVAMLVTIPCIVFVEAFRVLPFTAELAKLQSNSTKSISVIRSSRISDHWKERILPHYARKIFQSTCLLAAFLAVCCCTFAVAYFATGYILKSNLAQSLDAFLRIDTQLAALLVGSLYAVLRTKLLPAKPAPHQDYSASSSFLHHIALNYTAIRELAFELDCTFTRPKPSSSPKLPPVFVTGLARGGTTILLEALYSTGLFTTLTYRNMPFVTAPNLWPKLSQPFYRAAEKKERAHGDRLEVNFDSPEAFEEVFWLTFSRQKYIQAHSLAFQRPDAELTKNYRKYVNNILATSVTDGTNSRYLAKNNNNLLRIDLIKSAFPDSVILVPFRNPLDQARSLLKQHQRFCQLHAETPFVCHYMTWLGHHEFGENIKLFEVDDRYRHQVDKQAHSLEFWIDYWSALYAKLLRDHSHQVTFFNYDQLCSSPAAQLAALATLLELPPTRLSGFAEAILPARTYELNTEVSPVTVAEANKVHEQLVSIALT